MLKLVDVKKDYFVGNQTIHALRGVSLTFGDSGFVSILGQSGCGKTTLMNVVGGLDRYSSGNVLIDGKSTEHYTEKDWNTYRNNTVGFVFQSYNLIPHMSVLDNVELALTLSGVKNEERKRRALVMLEKVGLKEQARKRPNQLSGGQCQRVAIARALVNDPEIILADEPTGAIDSETAITIMELLKDVSRTKLVIMVTHNPDLAESYSDRIITMKDGLIVEEREKTAIEESPSFSTTPDDVAKQETEQTESSSPALIAQETVSAPAAAEESAKKKPEKKATMRFLTAVKLSFHNLIHKKGRTIMTVIAGSIGIICIFLILAMNSGFSYYIRDYETESLTKYPIRVGSQSNSFLELIQKALDGKKIDVENIDLEEAIDLFSEDDSGKTKYPTDDTVYLSRVLLSVIDDMDSLQAKLKSDTDISKFSAFMDERYLPEYGTVRKDYGLNLNVYEKSKAGFYTKINPLSDTVVGVASSYIRGISESTKNKIKTVVDSLAVWSMMVDDRNLLASQYDVLAGVWPDYTTEDGRNGLVLVVDEYNELDDTTLVFLNKIDVITLMMAMLKGNSDDIPKEYSFESFLETQYALMVPTDYYEYNAETNLYEYDDSTQALHEKSVPLHISAIVRLKEGLTAGCIGGTIGYTQALAEYVLQKTCSSALVAAQYAEYDRYVATMEKAQEINARMTEEGKTVEELPPQDQLALMQAATASVKNVTTGEGMTLDKYNQFITDLQVIESDKPKAIYYYPSSIESKNAIIALINEYNAMVQNDEELKASSTDYGVTYTDDLSEITDSMRGMIDTITYVLVAVAIIAVVVAMLLVAIILYISVQDRTKEIGILRAIGAGRGNVSELFIAETFIIGLVSGLVGVLIGYVLSFPADAIIYKVLHIRNLLRPTIAQAGILVVFSFVTTVISGLVPAVIAARKDPVIALRTE